MEPLEIAGAIVREFEKRSGLHDLEYELKERQGESILIIFMANPTERFFDILQDASNAVEQDLLFPVIPTIKRKPSTNYIGSPEGRLLAREIIESLNVNRNSFSDDFFTRYIKSVTGEEEKIISRANHMVFGRRGAGKSMLLLYALHMRRADSFPSAWVDMQTYAHRADGGVAAEVITEILEQLSGVLADEPGRLRLLSEIQKVQKMADGRPKVDDLRVLAPSIRRVLKSGLDETQDIAIFLDDFHVVDASIQPNILGLIYSCCRGERIFLKISAIETLSRNWDRVHNVGLEIPHDTQQIKLDYNLTMPDKAIEHIQNILDAHARYCGLPSVRSLCSNKDVISRLVWVAAGVPRDALNIFSQAMTEAHLKGSNNVTVEGVNVAAGRMVQEKIRELDVDVSSEDEELRDRLESIKEFCISKEHKNAFLFKIDHSDPNYEQLLKLVDLRLLHVIHEGIVRGEAGEKYVAMILDYGLYIGMRATRSLALFNKQTKKVKYEEVRMLPVYRAA